MRSPLLRVVVLGLASLVLAACDGGGDGAHQQSPTPASLTIVSGDGQSGTVATELPLELTVRVTDASAQPYPGATVTWAVTSGGGGVAPASSTSMRWLAWLARCPTLPPRSGRISTDSPRYRWTRSTRLPGRHYRDTIQNEERRAAALALLAKVVALHRKAKGFAGKRGKGAGRKAKAKDAKTSEASALEQFHAAANYLMVHWMDVSDDQRKVRVESAHSGSASGRPRSTRARRKHYTPESARVRGFFFVRYYRVIRLLVTERVVAIG